MEILKVPKLNENMETAMVGPWSKSVGDPVDPGDVIVELITDKASFELQVVEKGVLIKAGASEKSTVPVGYVLAVIGDPDEEIPDIDAENAVLMNSYMSGLAEDIKAAPRSQVKATPAARRLALEEGIDISDIASSLDAGAIIDKDCVLKYMESRT